MKNTFFEYYILSDEVRIKNIWNEAIIVLDANVLLNLYRYTEASKDNLLEVLEYYKDRLWIPYQVGLEYHQNRIAVYFDMNAAYKQIADSLEKETAEFIKKLNLSKYTHHPKIEIKWFEEKIRLCIGELKDKLLEIESSCSFDSEGDNINEKVSELFNGKVGKDFDVSELDTLYKEGSKRYGEKIPPGYCDAKGKKDRGNRHLYGDLIWWKQVIKEAREKECNVILVTDDVKEDWYERVKGKTIGPRIELIKEFRSNTNKDILIYPTSKFLEYARENMTVTVDPKTISEIKQIQSENEAIEGIISSLNKEDEDAAVKIFSENPWMSAESFLQKYVNPNDSLSSFATKYTDILEKQSPNIHLFEGIGNGVTDYSNILCKSILTPNDSLSSFATKYTGILEKQSPNINLFKGMAGDMSDYSNILGNNFLNLLERMDSKSYIHGGIHLATDRDNTSKSK